MVYQTLGTIRTSATQTTDVPSQKTVQQEETRLKLLAPSQSVTRLNILASPRVRNLQDTTPLKPLASPHGTTPLKPSARDWVLPIYYFGHIFLDATCVALLGIWRITGCTGRTYGTGNSMAYFALVIKSTRCPWVIIPVWIPH